MLMRHYAVDPPSLQEDIMKKLSEYCGKPLTSHHNDSYGNLSPSSATGRYLMIVYALIGIPLNGIMLATLAEFFSTALLRVHRRYKTKRTETRAGMIADVVLYLVPGFAIFIFLPTGVFMHFEGWSFDESLYYAFVTLTTIGFGDFVAGQTDKLHDDEVLYILYKTLLLIWIIFGLGYLVMILGFITRAMRSKKVARLEHKLATNLKHTQSKIWSTFTRDVSYLRRTLNELYVMKLKPVYKDGEPTAYKARTRSSSEPMLYMMSPKEGEQQVPGFGVWRRRANSETAAGIRLPKVLSESDLGRIDRDATFRTAALIQPGELLAHMVKALGNEEQGIQGFSDAEILASEEGTTWSIGGESIPKRSRAASDVRIPMKEQMQNAEWTWSGDQASRRVHELMRARHKSLIPTPSSGRRPSIFQLAAARLKHPLKRYHKAKSIGDISADPRLESQNYLTHHPASDTMHPALEETSLADFLRAMNSLQTRVAGDTMPVPKRKEAVAGLTPPSSLTNLFVQSERRMSLHPTPTPRLHTAALRRTSLHPASRRFSVHPAASGSLPSSNQSTIQQPLRRMAPHLFQRQKSDPSQRFHNNSTSDR
ncbi:hypothetical protein C0J52_10769 [Blattella germanica]|nr:hypothetical protein C0J52_10769 [Blattella germanica]